MAGAAIPVLAIAEDELAARCTGAIRAALAALPPGPALLNSYIVKTGAGAGDFDLTQANAAYVYDNALAGLALLAGGYEAEARQISDALALAQANDRFWHDGRLRNAYQVGPMAAPAKLPGWWDAGDKSWKEDPYQAGSETGPVAWAMLLWLALGNRDPAVRAAKFIDERLRARNGYYGGFYGFEPNPLKLLWQSTEQNTDLFAAFTRLGDAVQAAHAGGFVHAMFDPDQNLFGAGLSPSGSRNALLAADAGIWPYLAGLGPAASAEAAIRALQRGAGIGFSAASQSVWLEGTAFAALALQRGGDTAAAKKFFSTVAEQISPSGYVYATIASQLSTGLTVGPSLIPGQPEQAFNYFRRPSLSATAWAALAARCINPLAVPRS